MSVVPTENLSKFRCVTAGQSTEGIYSAMCVALPPTLVPSAVCAVQVLASLATDIMCVAYGWLRRGR